MDLGDRVRSTSLEQALSMTRRPATDAVTAPLSRRSGRGDVAPTVLVRPNVMKPPTSVDER